MFDGLPSSSDHFHQFIAPTTRTTTTTTTAATLPFHNHHHLSSSPSPSPSSSSFSPLLHHASLTPTNTNTTFLPFDPYNNNPHHHHHHHHIIPLLQQQPNATLSSSLNNNNNILFHSATTTDDEERDQTQLLPNDLVDSSSWSNDEVVALLRIRSSVDTSWFPQLTYWDHVSRKLGELGFKKSGDKCKEKFEDETRYFNNYAKNNSYRFLNELEELYQGDNNHNQSSIVDNQDHVVTENTQDFEHQINAGDEDEEEEEEEGSRDDKSVKEQQCEEEEEEEDNKSDEKKMMTRKRKKRCRFEKLKGFCESIVNNMMAQQEEIHNKLIEDMLRRDEEKLQREEEWKKQETERMNKELQIMAQEQAIAGDRQASIIQFLKKYASTTTTTTSPNDNPSSSDGDNNNNNQLIIPTHQIQNPSSIISDTLLQVPSSSNNTTTTSSSSLNRQDHIIPPEQQSNSISTVNNDVGRRWPRDEVMALINLRCESLNKMNNNNNGGEEREIGNNNNNKVPLWERISQGMSDLGYKRSAKRCKEKWENINKYFRKTKDVNKKRSIDSRTCPYFHQLKTLYDEGRLVHQPETMPESHHAEQMVVPPVRSTGGGGGAPLNFG